MSTGSSITPLRRTADAPLERALVATGFSYASERRSSQAEILRHVLPRVRDLRRAGAAALDLAWVAAGRLDAYWERGLNGWDWSAGILLVHESGRRTARLPGKPRGLAAAGPELLPRLVELVTDAEAADLRSAP